MLCKPQMPCAAFALSALAQTSPALAADAAADAADAAASASDAGADPTVVAGVVAVAVAAGVLFKGSSSDAEEGSFEQSLVRARTRAGCLAGVPRLRAPSVPTSAEACVRTVPLGRGGHSGHLN